MGKFKRWVFKTFTGIYGIDNLYFVLFGAALVIIIINAIFRHWAFWLVEALIIGYMLFRAFSHNKTARRKENDAFFGFLRAIGNWFRLQKNKFRDRKTYKYKKCPKCHATLRLPKRKGKHNAVCPRCGNHFTVK